VAQDGTTIAACASRHKLVNEGTLVRRTGELEEAIAHDEQGNTPDVVPDWMANFPETRLEQRERYQKASERLKELHIQNEQRRACKRRPSAKIVVSLSDPDSACGRDKLKVYRPLYNVQLHYDVDSPFILGYETFQQTHDNGTLEIMVERTMELVGVKPEVMLADATYASISDLEVCEQNAITLYAPIGQNDFSEKKNRKPQTNQFTQLPKSKFTWLPEEATYACPQGNRLVQKRRGESNDRAAKDGAKRCSVAHLNTVVAVPSETSARRPRRKVAR
jgi:hypothetical protein